MMGLGLATAIALDATVVRLVLVPAIMALLGRACWYLLAWLDRRLPRTQWDQSEVRRRPAALVGAGSVPE